MSIRYMKIMGSTYPKYFVVEFGKEIIGIGIKREIKSHHDTTVTSNRETIGTLTYKRGKQESSDELDKIQSQEREFLYSTAQGRIKHYHNQCFLFQN